MIVWDIPFFLNILALYLLCSSKTNFNRKRVHPCRVSQGAPYYLPYYFLYGVHVQ